LQDQDQDQDQDFKILSRQRLVWLPSEASVQDQDKDFASQNHDQDLFYDVYWRPTEKHVSFLAVNENDDENEIPFYDRKRNENKNGHSFSAENENESHLII